MSNFVEHKECPECGSKDNVAVYDDGHEYCFTDDCDYQYYPDNDIIYEESNIKSKDKSNEVLLTGTIKAIEQRRILQDTCEMYGVMYSSYDQLIFPFYKDGIHIANKVRNNTKDFFSQGNISDAELFGQKNFKNGGNYITLTEGEIDCLSVYQMLGSKWPVVSIKNGAQSAVKDVTDNYDFLMSYDTIVISFDNDEPGKKAAKKVAEILSPKAKIMPMRHKDGNDYLCRGATKKFRDDWWNAKSYAPEGIVAGSTLWDTVMEGASKADVVYPWTKLQDLTYGIRKGELVTITAGSGLGKSQVIKELVYHILNNSDDKIGLMFLEESIKRTGLSIMSLEIDKPLHLPDAFYSTPDEDIKIAFDKTLGTDRLFLYDHFGSNSVESIISKVRYFGNALKCGYVILDHVSIVVSDQSQGDERKAIDEVMTKLRTLCQELNIALIIVSHLKRPASQSHEEGGVTTLAQLRGSGSIGQLSDMVIGLERNSQHEDEIERHTTQVRVLKNRFSGLSGPADRLLYNRDTGRMTEREDEFEEDLE